MKPYAIIESDEVKTVFTADGFTPKDGEEITQEQHDEIIDAQQDRFAKVYLIDGVVSVEVDEVARLAEAKHTKIIQAKADCRQAIEAGFEYMGDVYQCEEKDQNNYNSLKVLFDILPDEVEITLKDGTAKQVAKTDLNGLFVAAFQHKATQMSEYRTKKEAIDACESIEELVAI